MATKIEIMEARDFFSGDTEADRKSRGAFFTPAPIARYIAQWAIRSQLDSVFEPSCGDAAFLVEAVGTLRSLGNAKPVVEGVEIHEPSARLARSAVSHAGGVPRVRVSDFFDAPVAPRYDAVIGNPPYVRYQQWSGRSRAKSRAAALAAGVNLSNLSSSWAAFVVHSTAFLNAGGRLGLVLPAELLSTNYAAPVRKFLFDSFDSVELVLFTERVFPEVEADVVLLLADGFRSGPTNHAHVFQAQNANELNAMLPAVRWAPEDPAAKWTASLMSSATHRALTRSVDRGQFGTLLEWGETTLGMVTGNNRYFALSSQRVSDLSLRRSDVVRLSPPGSSHLRGLTLSAKLLHDLDQAGSSTWLFRPKSSPSPEALEYIRAGEIAGVHEAYKTRIRKEWWKVPLLPAADLLLTYMNADTPRLVENQVRAHHLNSVHGVYLRSPLRDVGRRILPVASLNSISLLSAEIAGRSYGGGILKLEPREADGWLMPSTGLVNAREPLLAKIRPAVAHCLRVGELSSAVELVDDVLLDGVISKKGVLEMRSARADFIRRRTARGGNGKR